MDLLTGTNAALGAALSGFALALAALVAPWLLARRTDPALGAAFLRRLVPPGLVLGILFGLRLTLPLLTIPIPGGVEVVRHSLALLLIAGIGWLVIGLCGFVDAYLAVRFPLSVADNLNARRIHTRFLVLRRLALALTLLLCGSAALMTFPGMRALGSGLLASAGIIGIVLGIAARPTVEAFIAGIQVAWTQPLRLDDVVIVEGEWGRIEEIRTTYVVVRLWDLRRLIVPLQHLLTRPFQNWTRSSSDLLGAVTVEVDYRTPVEAVRSRVGEILAESERFGGGFWNLQVVEAGPQTLRLRVLVTAPNADVAWDLRCEVREKLVAWLRDHHPECLPRVRAEIADPAGDAPVAAR